MVLRSSADPGYPGCLAWVSGYHLILFVFESADPFGVSRRVRASLFSPSLSLPQSDPESRKTMPGVPPGRGDQGGGVRCTASPGDIQPDIQPASGRHPAGIRLYLYQKQNTNNNTNTNTNNEKQKSTNQIVNNKILARCRPDVQPDAGRMPAGCRPDAGQISAK